MAESTDKETGTKPVEKKEEEKRGGGLKWVLYAAVVILIILAAAYLTLGVVISEAPPAASYPYTTTYFVSLPNSQVVTIGNTEIIAVPSENSDRVTLSINKEPKDMGIGETRVVQERRAIITALAVKVMDFDFRVDATYQGKSGTTSQFYLAFRTSKQVPSFLIERLLPPGVHATPV
ncbi:MAG TPA: hypothetical protein VMS81_01475 [Methanomicrobiales archaeon]|jgi:heme/copper-type cytochrome/quinol oxidase subunit 2|nr:hypothetical protein [Methanomicrobiales archaeon]